MPIDSPPPGHMVVSAPDAIQVARGNVMDALDRIRASMISLREEATVRTDWRTYVRSRPGAFLVAALLVGFLFGSRRHLQPRGK
jgi:hypothetical protein